MPQYNQMYALTKYFIITIIIILLLILLLLLLILLLLLLTFSTALLPQKLRWLDTLSNQPTNHPTNQTGCHHMHRMRMRPTTVSNALDSTSKRGNGRLRIVRCSQRDPSAGNTAPARPLCNHGNQSFPETPGKCPPPPPTCAGGVFPERHTSTQ